MLALHDGPELAQLAAVTQFSAAMIALGRLPAHRLALVSPDTGTAGTPASLAYAHALHRSVLPAVRNVVRVGPAPVLAGVSLGALAALHAATTFPGTWAALFLQSGSFFRRESDGHEQFCGIRRHHALRAIARRCHGATRRLDIGVTVGLAEENLTNNRVMAAALTRLGHRVTLVEVPDAHVRRLARRARPSLDQPVGSSVDEGIAMRRDVYDLYSPAIGASGGVIAYGHWGRPLLVFPSEQGRAVDYENNGMVDAVAWLIDAGRVKLYCVDTFDAQTWSRSDLPVEERAASSRRLRVVDHRPGRTVRLRRLRRPVGIVTTWMQPRRLSRGQPRATPGRPVSARHRPVRQLRPDARGTPGEHAVTRSTSANPLDYVPNLGW